MADEKLKEVLYVSLKGAMNGNEHMFISCNFEKKKSFIELFINKYTAHVKNKVTHIAEDRSKGEPEKQFQSLFGIFAAIAIIPIVSSLFFTWQELSEGVTLKVVP